MHQNPADPFNSADEREITHAQQGLWFLLQEAGSRLRAAYNMVFAFAVQGTLDVDRLRAALGSVADAHEALRSRFALRDGLGVQIVEPSPVIDLRWRESNDDAATVAHKESALPVDLTDAPAWRVTLVRPALNAPVTAVVFVFSHAIFDERSARVFFADLAQAFGSAGPTPPSRDCGGAASTHSAAEAERNYLAQDSGREAIERTATNLLGMPSHLALPRSGPATDEAHELAGVQFWLTAAETVRVANFASEHRTSVATVHLAAFQILLWRYTGQCDFGVSLPVSPRAALKSPDVIGYLTNLAVVRARICGTMKVSECLGSVTDSLLDVLDAAAVPFPAVVKRLRRTSGQLHGSFLQVGFGHIREEEASVVLGDATLGHVEVLPRYAKNELKLDVREGSGGTRLWFLYDRDGCDREFVEQMAEDYRRLLEALLERPQAKLKELSLLDEASRHCLLQSWSGAAQAGEAEGPWVHQCIEAQAAKAPQAVALVGEAGELSYGELNARANRLARRLRSMGVGPDVLVGVCTEGGVALVTAVLAVLKAGGAYVPLDPDYPAERLAHMVHDAAATVVLVAPGCEQRLPDTVRQVAVGNAADDAAFDESDLHTPLQGEHLAYCIYTSGSTGRPKGAANTHRGFANLVRWYAGECLDGVGVRVLLASSPSFDMTQKSLLGTLAAGATLVVPAGGARDIDALREALRRHAPTVICCAPSAYRAYVDDPGTLRTAVLGGEALDAALAAQVHAQGLRLFNSYGPTECADIALRHRVAPGQTEVPLGRPLPNVRVYVLDEHGQPVPVGAVGELHIAGAGVARGYVGRPELTAEKFVPDPFGPPGARMYRTGDLARFRRDGLLEFLGRADHQVKVRGFRIELGEVENALLQCAGVREAAVLAPTDTQGQRWLVAYLSAAEGVLLEPAPLRQALASTLPAHMVPTAWHVLPALPLNGSGKIDRQALAQLQVTTAPVSAHHEPPANATEALLAAIWADVLRVDRVGRHDDFFALGGHSLSATQVVARVTEALGVRTKVRELFESPTLAAFASLLDSSSGVAGIHVEALPAIAVRPRRSVSQTV